jgi:hypothetical protein
MSDPDRGRPSAGREEPRLDERIRLVLVDPQRRQLLRVLCRRGPVRVAALASLLATTEGVRNSQDRHRELFLDLHHDHLPTLRETGLVEYDGETGELSLAVPAWRVESALEATDRWLGPGSGG